MQLVTLPATKAVGHILRHNLADAAGRKAFSKGARIAEADLERLHELGYVHVSVAILEPDDVHEDEAAARLAAAVCGTGMTAGRASHSRVNVLAAVDGVLQVDVEALLRINAIDGLTIATLASATLVRAQARAATIKIIPFAVPEAALREADAIARASGGVLTLRALQQYAVGVILVGSAAALPRLERTLLPPVAERVHELGSQVAGVRAVESDEAAVAEAIARFEREDLGMLIIAGETSIMDRDDVTPRAIRRAGGRIEHYGAPVEPGNLLLMAYLGTMPVLGAPGCVRSRTRNIVDLLLPRLLSGEHITARDIIALGHGGLLGS
jgi:molybdopterin biosynthesis enzyme